jgi:hypothetical protein
LRTVGGTSSGLLLHDPEVAAEGASLGVCPSLMHQIILLLYTDRPVII